MSTKTINRSLYDQMKAKADLRLATIFRLKKENGEMRTELALARAEIRQLRREAGLEVD